MTANTVKFLKKNPTLIGHVAGHVFYEHPTLGDEHPLIMINPRGELKLTDYFDLPSPSELLEQD